MRTGENSPESVKKFYTSIRKRSSEKAGEAAKGMETL
jgi:hypothetical protein